MASNVEVLHIILLAITFRVSCSENNLKELRTKETNQDKIIQLGHSVKYKRADPSKVVQLSWQPRVFLYRDFLSNEECDYLISQVHAKKSHTGWGNDSQSIGMSRIPTNFNVSLDADDEVIRMIEERISAWTFLPKENSLSLQILHFGSGDFEHLYNYFNGKSVDEPILATVILYLSDVNHGGQIIFPHSNNKILSDCASSLKQEKGNAVVFFNLHLNAAPDTSSSHARCPVLVPGGGDLWCAAKLFYLHRVVSGAGERGEDSAAGCTDEDENCPHWAAIGECQRNPVFMIGSPDYYGTCRKSCHACHLK
ncbi:probable prolyl 4-hydroxylase 12 isoform X2 [Andrographis paniculata]|uniref:probable prolyl 4-hydroxylase 12 isoform X2 n=1 Tax=Andrographis paniculata TaxID=175694 RepID=UPI0021E764CE|nr:probable prolyl 4-hydroxylase 12 isoform X2 [Andrographis paniculata]